MSKKRFTVGEIKHIVAKTRVEKPIGYMDKRWNLAIDTMFSKLERIAAEHDAGFDSDDNIRLIKLPEKRQLP